jgi:type II secretory pathway predicted ATPase ExeA
MIQFRLQRAGLNGEQLFTEEAVALIQDHSKGSPRKITLMCHHALESLIMQDRRMVEKDIIQALISTEVT